MLQCAYKNPSKAVPISMENDSEKITVKVIFTLILLTLHSQSLLCFLLRKTTLTAVYLKPGLYIHSLEKGGQGWWWV